MTWWTVFGWWRWPNARRVGNIGAKLGPVSVCVYERNRTPMQWAFYMGVLGRPVIDTGLKHLRAKVVD